MKTAIKTGPFQTTSGAQATEDPDLLAANGRAAVREVEIEIARILEQGKKKRGEASNLDGGIRSSFLSARAQRGR